MVWHRARRRGPPYLRGLSALEVSADGIDEEAGALLFDRFGEVLQEH
ncbi:MAG: hypothetical protein IPJ34_36855 [Myxococcales bacterium]|nr:hypothetical protein [Myxococcales bacterium]